MTRNELLQALMALSDDYNVELDPRLRVERALARLYGHALKMPAAIAQNYEGFARAEIEAAARTRIAQWPQDRPVARWIDLDVVRATNDEALAFEIGTELSALELFLLQLRDEGSGGTDDPDTEYRIEDLDSFLIPVPAIELNRSTFARSALRHHRILPTESCGVRIRLYAAPTRVADERASNLLAGALFSGLSLEVAPEVGGASFHVVDIACADCLEQVSDHFGALHNRESCIAAVWPELTGTPDVRQAILNGLSGWPFGERARRRPVLAVPGSWHEGEDPRVNQSIVSDGFGNPIFAFKKRMKFVLDGRQEDITSGDELPVLVLGDHLIAFGVCRDYCDGAHPTPYTDLHVDVTLVPSMGAGTTFEAHRSAAEAAYLRRGAGAFVVQQDLGGTAAAQGWVHLLKRRSAPGPNQDSGGIHFRTL